MIVRRHVALLKNGETGACVPELTFRGLGKIVDGGLQAQLPSKRWKFIKCRAMKSVHRVRSGSEYGSESES